MAGREELVGLPEGLPVEPTAEEPLHPDEAAVLDAMDSEEPDPSNDTEQVNPGDDDAIEGRAGHTEPARSHVDPDQVFGRLEKAAAAYARALEKIDGVNELGFEPCPCCAVPGLVLPYQPMQLQEQARRDRVDAYFGTVRGELEPLPNDAECPVCKGWGKLKTASRIPEQATQPCAKCNATGHVLVPHVEPLPVLTPQQPAAAPQPVYTFNANAPADEWGRPAGHPHYGIHPANVYV